MQHNEGQLINTMSCHCTCLIFNYITFLIINAYYYCISNICTFMKSEKTLDDTACMDSLFTMSIHTPRRYILELLLIQSAHTFWEAQRHNTKIN